MLCAWPVLPGKDKFHKLVATTIVQIYSIPFPAFKVSILLQSVIHQGHDCLQ